MSPTEKASLHTAQSLLDFPYTARFPYRAARGSTYCFMIQLHLSLLASGIPIMSTIELGRYDSSPPALDPLPSPQDSTEDLVHPDSYVPARL